MSAGGKKKKRSSNARSGIYFRRQEHAQIICIVIAFLSFEENRIFQGWIHQRELDQHNNWNRSPLSNNAERKKRISSSTQWVGNNSNDYGLLYSSELIKHTHRTRVGLFTLMSSNKDWKYRQWYVLIYSFNEILIVGRQRRQRRRRKKNSEIICQQFSVSLFFLRIHREREREI